MNLIAGQNGDLELAIGVPQRVALGDVQAGERARLLAYAAHVLDAILLAHTTNRELDVLEPDWHR